QKIVEESPSLCLSPVQRETLLDTAVRLARLFDYQNVGTVEFLVDGAGNFYFSEIKARIQIEHTVTEMTTRI
ncbi:MAG TPA: acetyl-CoA carboxylase biotin carboxylase subunit, partial [Promineifilum sp.]|nr:acetyl-CoA carboxylase biotin carboxylase subunit [Promineifilum sp.]